MSAGARSMTPSGGWARRSWTPLGDPPPTTEPDRPPGARQGRSRPDADLILIRHIRGMRSSCTAARRPAQHQGDSDRGCPLGTVIDRLMWHAGGTAGEDDVGSAWQRWAPARAIGEAVQGNPSLVGKSPEGSRQPVGEIRIPAPPGALPARARVAAVTCDSFNLYRPGLCPDLQPQ